MSIPVPDLLGGAMVSCSTCFVRSGPDELLLCVVCDTNVTDLPATTVEAWEDNVAGTTLRTVTKEAKVLTSWVLTSGPGNVSNNRGNDGEPSEGVCTSEPRGQNGPQRVDGPPHTETHPRHDLTEVGVQNATRC